MKTLMILPFAVLFFCAAVFAQGVGQPKIAVYVTGDLGESEKRALGTEILSALVKSGRYVAVERSSAFTAEIEREQVAQRSGAIDDSQISALGKQFGVGFICVVDVVNAFGEHQMSARVLDVETAEVVSLGKASGTLSNLRAVVEISEAVVNNMFGIDTEVKKEYISEFTFDEQSRTFGWNFALGAGSLFIMKDYVGAIGGLAIGGTGIYLFFDAIGDKAEAGDMEVSAGKFWGGFILYLVGTSAWSVYRIIAFKKPRPKEPPQASVADGLNFAVFPDAKGGLAVYAGYSAEF